LRGELATERENIAAAGLSASEHMRLATEASTRLESAETLLGESRAAQAALTAALDATKAEKAEADKATALARQETEAIRKQMADWEKVKEKFLDAARSATLGSATELSNKLLEDHKRESKAAKEEGEKRVGEATKQLLSQFESLSKTVSSLNDRVEGNAKTVDVIERALSNPGGAGYAAETVLENTLKSFGLRAETDYVLQRTVGGGLRPDALVFLPGNTVLVIDSKASKFILELAEAEGEEAEEVVNAKLAASMNQHLKDLTGKKYRDAVRSDYRSVDRSSDASHLVSIMWLPNDAAVEKVLRADPDFQRKASDKKIYVVGPTGLWTAVGIAGLHINLGRQEENRDRIVVSVRTLIESMTVMLEHAGLVGSGLKRATDAYARLTSSINGRVLPRVRKLVEQGIEAPAKGLPKPMPGFQVVQTEMADVIDTDGDIVEAPRELPPPAD
jgi:DNA recombination protein RmuC